MVDSDSSEDGDFGIISNDQSKTSKNSNKGKVKKDNKNDTSENWKNHDIAVKILGFVDEDRSNQHKCVVTFQSNAVRLVPYSIVREKYPQILIDYYEKYMEWIN